MCVDRVGESSCLVLMVSLREPDVTTTAVDDGLTPLEDETNPGVDKRFSRSVKGMFVDSLLLAVLKEVTSAKRSVVVFVLFADVSLFVGRSVVTAAVTDRLVPISCCVETGSLPREEISVAGSVVNISLGEEPPPAVKSCVVLVSSDKKFEVVGAVVTGSLVTDSSLAELSVTTAVLIDRFPTGPSSAVLAALVDKSSSGCVVSASVLVEVSSVGSFESDEVLWCVSGCVASASVVGTASLIVVGLVAIV